MDEWVRLRKKFARMLKGGKANQGSTAMMKKVAGSAFYEACRVYRKVYFVPWTL